VWVPTLMAIAPEEKNDPAHDLLLTTLTLVMRA
jgi:hypothetical protein